MVVTRSTYFGIAAQTVWCELRQCWVALGLWRIDSEATKISYKYAVFSLTLPATPPAAAILVPLRSSKDDWATAVYRTMSELWELQALQCMYVIWMWRHQCPPSTVRWTQRQAASIARTTIIASVATVQRGARHSDQATLLHQILRVAASTLARHQPSSLPALNTEYLLFFDGGSRGNPGPGGAGAVVVQVDADGAEARICWSAAMSLAARSTTNNLAEYVGVKTGLSQALRQGWTPLTVIGDSHLILRQLARYRPPLSERLKPLYIEARQIADRLNIVAWRHHLRAYNKMADHAANVAMDSKCSLQTFHLSDRPEWRGLDQFFQGDFAQWSSSALP